MNNRVYQNQFFLLAFICVTAFKVAMLPALLVSVASKNAIYSMAFMIIVEVIMFCIVYYLSCNTSLIDLKMTKWVKAVLLLLMAISITFKLNIYTIESCTYVANNVFDKASIYSILIVTIISIVYIASKGYINIARMCEIIFWVLFIAFLFNIVFASVNLDFNRIFSAKVDKTTFSAMDKYIVWFGDFTPFLVMSIVKPKGVTTFSIISVIAFILCPILLMIGFIGIYGDAGKYIEFAFSNLAIFNRFSEIIGSFDIPVILAFLMCVVIKLSVMVCALIEIVNYFINKKAISCCIVLVIYCVITFITKNTQNSVIIATSVFRYIITAIEYGTPLFILAYTKIFKIKHEDIKSRLSEVAYEK